MQQSDWTVDEREYLNKFGMIAADAANDIGMENMLNMLLNMVWSLRNEVDNDKFGLSLAEMLEEFMAEHKGSEQTKH